MHLFSISRYTLGAHSSACRLPILKQKGNILQMVSLCYGECCAPVNILTLCVDCDDVHNFSTEGQRLHSSNV